MRISIVGPCAAGKTVLAARLQQLDYNARSCAQEHSYVPNMWRRIANPDVLVYLDADLPAIARRRRIDWGNKFLVTLRHRLRDARQHCDLLIQTDSLSEEEVLATAIRFLEAFPKVEPSRGASNTPTERGLWGMNHPRFR